VRYFAIFTGLNDTNGTTIRYSALLTGFHAQNDEIAEPRSVTNPYTRVLPKIADLRSVTPHNPLPHIGSTVDSVSSSFYVPLLPRPAYEYQAKRIETPPCDECFNPLDPSRSSIIG